MPTVHLYRFRGTYRETPEFAYAAPEAGATHDGLVFVRQDEDVRDDAAARAACLRYGFADVEILGAGAIRPDKLEQLENGLFVPFVRQAFADGAALRWYTS